MTDQVGVMAAPTTERGWHFPRGEAWMLVSILPLWIVAFVSLQMVAPGGKPPNPETLAEAVAQLRDVSTPGWIAWTLFGSGIVVLTSLAALRLGRAVRGLRGGVIAMWLGVAAAVAGVLNAVATIYLQMGLKLADPPSYPPLIERFGLGTVQAEWPQALTFGLWAAAVGVAAAILWREKLLGRTALVVAVLAGVFLVITVVVPVPLFAALLLLVLGVALLRSRRTGSA